MTITPYEWQARDQEILAENNWTGLLNIEVGGGKSFAACWAIQNSGAKRVLIVAPDPTHKKTWVPSVEQILGITPRVIGGTGKAKKEALFDMQMGYEGVYLCTPQYLTRADISEWYGDFCVVDESHMLSAAGKAGQKKFSGYTPKEARESLSHRYEHRLALSGTAWRNNFERAWATARFLYPELDNRHEVAYLNHYMWKADRLEFEEIVTGFEWKPTTFEKYYARPDGVYGKIIDGAPHLGGAKTAKKWLNEAEPGRFINELPCVITHKRRERCCEWHPNGFLPIEEPREVVEKIELHPKQKKAIRELEGQYITWLGDNPLVVELPITMQMRLRQICLGVPTLTYETVTEVDEFGDEVEKVKERLDFADNCESPFTDVLLEKLKHMGDETCVVWMESQKFAEVLTKRLNKAGYPAFEYSGKTKKTRDQDLNEFGEGGKFQVMVAVLSAAGTGLDSLQHKTSTEFWFESSTDLTVNIQARGRTDRLGAKRQVDRHIFVDDFGYAEGRLSTQLEKQLALAKTLRRV